MGSFWVLSLKPPPPTCSPSVGCPSSWLGNGKIWSSHLGLLSRGCMLRTAMVLLAQSFSLNLWILPREGRRERKFQSVLGQSTQRLLCYSS